MRRVRCTIWSIVGMVVVGSQLISTMLYGLFIGAAASASARVA
jgi:hypothetical protein